MISKENCYLKSYQKIEKPRSVDLLLKRFQLELISRNYSHVIKCVTIFIIKNNNNLQSYSNHDIEFNCILNMAEYFPNILNKGAHRILFILTQDAILPCSHMYCISLYSSVFHPRIKTFISCIQLCFTQRSLSFLRFCALVTLQFKKRSENEDAISNITWPCFKYQSNTTPILFEVHHLGKDVYVTCFTAKMIRIRLLGPAHLEYQGSV